MEPSESYEVLHYLPAANLPYSQPGSCYTLVRLPDDDPTAGESSAAIFDFRPLNRDERFKRRRSRRQCRVRSAAR